MDMENLMAQAKQLQDKVASAQELLAKTKIKGIADNGAVIVDMSGKYDLLNLTISPDLLTKTPEIICVFSYLRIYVEKNLLISN